MQLPAPVRAAIGLAASAADEVKRLPDRALELPMLAVSTALQASLRAQQRYARLTARGDELLGRSRSTDDPPVWATFDEPVPVEELRRITIAQEREAHGAGPDRTDDADASPSAHPSAAPAAPAARTAPAAPRAKPARRATASARKSAGTGSTASARKSAGTSGEPGTPTPTTAKRISKPRNQAPSAFDRADDE